MRRCDNVAGREISDINLAPNILVLFIPLKFLLPSYRQTLHEGNKSLGECPALRLLSRIQISGTW